MRREASRLTATTVAVRGGLAFLIAFIGVLCLFSRADGQQPVPAAHTSVTQVTEQAPAPTEADKPCGKFETVGESSAHRLQGSDESPVITRVPAATTAPTTSTALAALAFVRGPAPPSSTTLAYTVLRI